MLMLGWAAHLDTQTALPEKHMANGGINKLSCWVTG